jgi:hypothetical protein
MPSIPVLTGFFVLGVVVAFGFAFTLIGLASEAVALLAAVGLIIRALGYLAGRIHRVASRQ